MKTMEEWEEEAYNKGKDIGENLTKALNSMTYENEITRGFVDSITSSHRTLQQSAMRSIHVLIMKWASMEESGDYDPRNEATVKFCKAVKDNAELEPLHFPFI